MRFRLLLVLALLVAFAPAAHACTVPWPWGGVGARAHVLLDSADVIVRAVAVGRAPGAAGRSPVWAEMGYVNIDFRVTETLKGRLPPGPLRVHGVLVRSHPVNQGPAPYAARRDGDGGSCFADTYVPGAEYLLVLKRRPHVGLTIHWASQALVNERIRGDDDPWLRYVRRHLAPRPRARTGG